MINNEKLLQQIEFIVEIDKLKTVFRKSYILGTNRKENDAEHSWHLAMMAILLQEYANEEIDLLYVIKMVLLHDIIEIDAGDTFCYDQQGNLEKSVKEQAAADRIYSMLPQDQGTELLKIWQEFEHGNSAEAKFARALDRLMPLLHNYFAEGKSWLENNITVSQVLDRNAHIGDGSITLWEYVQDIIEDSVTKGYLQTNKK
jgi:putative hydrolases of HD superfamily